MKRANEWTRDTLTKWGLAKRASRIVGPVRPRMDAKAFYAMVDGPTAFPLIAHPKAWSPGTDTLVASATPVDPKAKKAENAPRRTRKGGHRLHGGSCSFERDRARGA